MVTTRSMKCAQPTQSTGSVIENLRTDESGSALERQQALRKPSSATDTATHITNHYQPTASTPTSSAVPNGLDSTYASYLESFIWETSMTDGYQATEKDVMEALDSDCRDLMVGAAAPRPYSRKEFEQRHDNFVNENPGLSYEIMTARYWAVNQPSSPEFHEIQSLLDEFNAVCNNPSTHMINDSVHTPISGVDDWDPTSLLDLESPLFDRGLTDRSETHGPDCTSPAGS
jgi:hypothetical protein